MDANFGIGTLAWGGKGVIGGRMGARGGAAASRLAAIDTGIATRQVKHLILDPLKEPGTVAKPELGTKRLCGNCSAKFYDLNKDPIVCPKCHTVMELVAVNARALPRPPPRPRRKKRWWRRRPPRPNSSRSRKPTQSPKARRPPKARQPRAPRKRWRSKTRAWTTPPSSRSRRRATRTSPTSSGTATTRRRREAGSPRLLQEGFFWPGRGRLVTIHFKLRTRSS